MRVRLKLENKTHWQDADLRALIQETIKRYGEGDRRWDVTVCYTRQHRGCSGYAYVGTGYIKVRIPKAIPWKNSAVEVGATKRAETYEEALAWWKRNFCAVLRHEIVHCLGESVERDMRGHDMAMEMVWVDVFPLETKQKLTKSALAASKGLTLQEQRARTAVASLAKHLDELRGLESKVRRKQKTIAKWRKKVKYYEAALRARKESK